MAFWGYESQADAECFWGREQIASAPKTVKTIASATSKSCVGSIDGKTFMYADGSTDSGVPLSLVTAQIGNDRIGWTDG